MSQLVDEQGIKPDPDKIVTINIMLQPTNITELRRFLGIVNQLNKFSSNLADHMKPLHDLLSSQNQWMWGERQNKAFQEVKAALISSQTLCAFNPTLETIVSADASSFGLGAVLRQRQGAASNGLHFESAVGHREKLCPNRKGSISCQLGM